MIKIRSILLLVVVFCIPSFILANDYFHINYTIKPIFTSQKPFIQIKVEIKGNLFERIIIDFPSIWAGIEYAEQIKNIKLQNIDGKIQFKQHINGYQYIITIPKPINSINLSYEVHQKHDNTSVIRGSIIRKNLIHAVGYSIFVVPNALKYTNKKIEFNISWENLPKDWKTLSSYNMNETFNFVDEVGALLHAVYVAGNLRVYQIKVSNNLVYLSLHGEFGLKDRMIIQGIKKIIKTQRSFFKDHDFPYYAISLIEGNDPNSLGGTSLNNSFTMYLPKKIDRLTYNMFFAHEHLHTWIGGKIQNNEQEELNYWWTEGFTDYYSKVLMLRSGSISLEEFIKECNQFLRAYYLSPMLNEPNRKIKQDFWNDTNIQRLPYYRGFVFAIYLNHLIRKNNPSYSLDNIMLNLLKTKKFSVSSFKKIAKRYIPKGINEEISAFIDLGKTIELNDIAASLPIKKTKKGSYNLGFDKKALLTEKVIKNIDTRSNAYKAGLRNGDKIISWDISGSSEQHGDPNKTITLKTLNKTLSFTPEDPNKKSIYQFKSALFWADKAKINYFFGSQSKYLHTIYNILFSLRKWYHRVLYGLINIKLFLKSKNTIFFLKKLDPINPSNGNSFS